MAQVKLKVNEVFYSIQGEAAYTGTPSVFIRLQGCGVGCGWCDTKHTWSQAQEDKIDQGNIIGKTQDSPTWSEFTPNELVRLCQKLRGNKGNGHVVLTGGEPAEQELTGLVSSLWKAGYRTQIETSGTSRLPDEVYGKSWVTLSPKINMPGGLNVLSEVVHKCNEIKMPVGKAGDINTLKKLLNDTNAEGKLIWLQPLSESKKAMRLCVDACLSYNWQLSVQTHKILGVR